MVIGPTPIKIKQVSSAASSPLRSNKEIITMEMPTDSRQELLTKDIALCFFNSKSIRDLKNYTTGGILLFWRTNSVKHTWEADGHKFFTKESAKG